MSLKLEDVAAIAHLARLQITTAEQQAYAKDLTKILGMVEQLQAADTAQVEPMSHPLAGQVQRLRADEVTESDHHQKYQRNAARTEAGLYLVPKVIE
jgi:aspartyl-tRNA(Asn)/glutamyl-tRNA(Gln) amidotransferase subunit C